MDFTITDSLDKNKWREFVHQHPQGNIFQTPEMFEVFSKVKGYRPELRVAISKNGEVLALLLPVQVSLHGGLLRRLTTRSIAYGSTLCRPDASGAEALATLLQDYTQKLGREGLFTELRHQFDQSAYQSIFTQCGFNYQEQLNYLIDLDCSPEEIFNKFGSHAKRHIRRELKKGQVVIEDVSQSSKIQTAYGLIKKSYDIAHVPIPDISLFEAAFETLHPLGMIKIWIAWLGEVPIASSIELVYKDIILGWYGGVDRTYSKLTPNELLTWHIVKWGSEKGFRIYDFGGAGDPDKEYGVRDFKAKFGGQLVAYGRNTYVQFPALLRLSSIGYMIMRRFIRI